MAQEEVLYILSKSDVGTAILDFMSGTWANSRRVVEEVPELLGDATDEVLKELQDVAERQQDNRATRILREHRAVLEQCRQDGIEQTFTPREAIERLFLERDSSDALTLFLQDPIYTKPSVASLFREQIAERRHRGLLDDAKAAEELLALMEHPESLRTETGRKDWHRSFEALQPPKKPDRTGTLVDRLMAMRHTPATASERAALADEALRALHENPRPHFVGVPGKWEMELEPWLHLELSHALLELSSRKENDLDRSIAAARRAIDFLTKGADKPGLGIAYQNLANALFQRTRSGRANDLRDALAACHQGLVVRAREAMPLEWAATQDLLGSIYVKAAEAGVLGDPLDNLRLAIRCYERALEVRTEDDHPHEWAQTSNNLAGALANRSTFGFEEDAKKSFALLEASLRVRRKDTVPLEWARTAIRLASFYRQLSPDRRSGTERAIRLLKAVCDEPACASNVDLVAKINTNLGNAYATRLTGRLPKNLEKAIEYYRSTLELPANEVTTQDRAVTFSSLGNAYSERRIGDVLDNQERAIECHRSALKLINPETDPGTWCRVSSNLALAYESRLAGEQGANLDRAIEVLGAALEVDKARIPRADRGQLLHNLGFVYSNHPHRSTEKLIEAERHFEAALEYRTRSHSQFEWADTVMNLAIVIVQTHPSEPAHLERAVTMLEESLKVLSPSVNPLKWAQVQHNLAMAYLFHVEDEPGKPRRQSGFDAMRSALSVYRDYNMVRESYAAARFLGIAYGNDGEWSAAVRAFDQAIDAAEQLYDMSVLLRSRHDELRIGAGVYAEAAYARARSDEKVAAAVLLERGRARYFGEVLDRERADLQKAREQSPELVESYVLASNRVANAESAERRLVGPDLENPEPESPPHEKPAWDAERASAFRSEAIAARRDLNEAIEAIRALEGCEDFLRATTSEAVLEIPKEGECLVFAASCTWGMVIVAIPTSGMIPASPFTAFAAPIPDDILRALVVALHSSSKGVPSGPVWPQSVKDEALREVLLSIGQELISPLIANLRSWEATRVILVPCGALGLLPIHAAPTAGQNSTDTTNGALIDVCAVSYVPSARVLKAIRSRARSEHTEELSLVGVGNPLPNRRPLKFADAEVRQIAAYFPRAKVLSEYEAEVRTLYREGSHARYAHLACHAVFDPLSVLDSEIELSRSQRMTLREILTERPMARVKLVFLSGCETAMSEARDAPDEVIGFPAALLAAGTDGVIATTWAIDDLSATLIAVRFYELHLGVSGRRPMMADEALTKAQVWLRDATRADIESFLHDHPAIDQHCDRAAELHTVDERPFSSPYFWAPYVFFGSPFEAEALIAEQAGTPVTEP